MEKVLTKASKMARVMETNSAVLLEQATEAVMGSVLVESKELGSEQAKDAETERKKESNLG